MPSTVLGDISVFLLILCYIVQDRVVLWIKTVWTWYLLEKVSIRLELTDKPAEQFLSLKTKRGLTHNSEMIRQLITEAVRKELPQARA
jgi:hypothetical protein